MRYQSEMGVRANCGNRVMDDVWKESNDACKHHTLYRGLAHAQATNVETEAERVQTSWGASKK